MHRANYKVDLQLARNNGDALCFLKNLFRNPLVSSLAEALQNVDNIVQTGDRLLVLRVAPIQRGKQYGRGQSDCLLMNSPSQRS
jgi:hypothetical protein